MIETNTFGANAFVLNTTGLRDRSADSTGGVRLARQAANQIRDKRATEAFVAGAIGPLGVRS